MGEQAGTLYKPEESEGGIGMTGQKALGVAKGTSLFALQDEEFKSFTSSLIPSSRPIIGVRLPLLRSMAKEIAKGDWQTFLQEAPENYYEEVQLKGFVIGYAKAELSVIFPYITEHIGKIDDWSLCDSFCSNLKIVAKNRPFFLSYIEKLSRCEGEFPQRVAAVLLMDYYLTDTYIDQALAILDSLKNQKYYCKMAVAWAVATAWAKQREKTYYYLQPGNNSLDIWTYRKAIQKMLESRRVSKEDKEYLRQLREGLKLE